ncbi:MAG TPA: hypothetical protein VGQ83_03790 [Polyangia bacterium]
MPPAAAAPLAELRALLRAALPRPGVAADHVARIREGRGDTIAAVVYYGSHLWTETRKASSVPDFYVIADDLRAFHGARWRDALINAVMPPNVYYPRYAPVTPGQPPLTCKLSTISLAQLAAETAVDASDAHHIGRFSKRVGIIWHRDEAAAAAVVEASVQAMRAVTRHALVLLGPRFTLEELVLAALGLSYRGERRLTEPDKIANLLRAERDFYLQAYALVLDAHAAEGGALTRHGAGADATYQQPPADPRAARRTAAFLDRSRRREKLRWPKYLVTFDNWLDYLLDKLERHSGIRLELTERQRRYPLIFGWPLYFELRKKGVIR